MLVMKSEISVTQLMLSTIGKTLRKSPVNVDIIIGTINTFGARICNSTRLTLPSVFFAGQALRQGGGESANCFNGTDCLSIMRKTKNSSEEFHPFKRAQLTMNNIQSSETV